MSDHAGHCQLLNSSQALPLARRRSLLVTATVRYHSNLWGLLQDVVYVPFPTPLFLCGAVHLPLPLPFADQAGVFLADPSLWYSQNSQADDGGRLLCKLLWLFPERRRDSFSPKRSRLKKSRLRSNFQLRLISWRVSALWAGKTSSRCL